VYNSEKVIDHQVDFVDIDFLEVDHSSEYQFIRFKDCLKMFFVTSNEANGVACCWAVLANCLFLNHNREDFI